MKHLFLISLVTIFSIFYLFSIDRTESAQDTIKIGYCPTMSKYAEVFEKKGYSTVLVESSSEVLDQLATQEIQVALIGRKAKTSETAHTVREYIPKSGYTLISGKKEYVHQDELSEYTFHTAVEEKIASILLPFGDSVVYYATTKDAIQKGLPDVVLIDWKDYSDIYELFTPVNDMGKLEMFRTPFLYYDKDTEPVINQMKMLI